MHPYESAGADSGHLVGASMPPLDATAPHRLWQSRASMLPPLLPRTSGGPAPLSFAQQRLWLVDQLHPQTCAYHIVATMRLPADLDLAALERSLDTLIARHAALRTRITVVADEAVQEIVPPSPGYVPMPIEVAPLAAQRTADAWEAWVQTQVDEAARQPFYLATGPLLRLRLLQRGPYAPHQPHAPHDTSEPQERVSTCDHLLVVVLHHIIADGWSLAVFGRELAQLYAAFAAGQPSPLPDLPVQYADYADWQRTCLLQGPLEEDLRYWRQQLAGVPVVLDLPTDHVRPPVATMRGAVTSFTIAEGLALRLRLLAQEEHATLFMVLLAAFEVLLARSTDQDDLLVGSPIAGRTDPRTEDLIGFFVNTLVLRADLSVDAEDSADGPTFRTFLRRTRNVCLDAYAHQDMPFQRLVEDLQLARDLSRNPLVQALFALQPTPFADPEQDPPFSLREWRQGNKTAIVDLLLEIGDTPGALPGRCTYSTDLFSAATIDRMLQHFQLLLASIADDPDCDVWAVSLIPPAERTLVLETWTATATTYPEHSTIPDLLAEVAHEQPDACALVYGKRELSYHELDVQSTQLAQYLRTLGVTSDSVVGLCVERSIESIVGMLGILKAGGAYLPLEPGLPAQRLRWLVADARVTLVLTQRSLLPQLRQTLAEREEVSPWEVLEKHVQEHREEHTESEANWRGKQQRPVHLVALDDDPAYPPPPAATPTRPSAPASAAGLAASGISEAPAGHGGSSLSSAGMRGPDALAYVMYTSGSTGRPKGVCITHRGVVRLVRSNSYVPFGSDTVMLQFASLSFDAATFEIWGTLLNGGRLVIYPSPYAELDQLCAVLRTHSVTTLWLTSALFQYLVDHHLGELAAVTTLRHLLTGGDVVPVAHARRFLQAHPMCTLINGYGPTENTTFTCCCTLRNPDELGATFPIGRPIANTQVYVLDRHLQPVPIGVPGDLYIGGAGLARGYLHQPQLTAAAFLPHPFSPIPGARLYRSGDRARWRADGQLEFLGRRDDQVKIRGYRIEPAEVEAVLAQHPQVADCAVLPESDSPDTRPHDTKHLCAYVVLRTDSPPRAADAQGLSADPMDHSHRSDRLDMWGPDGSGASDASGMSGAFADDLRSYLQTQLPEYMIPTQWRFLAALPLAVSGKLDRTSLRNLSARHMETALTDAPLTVPTEPEAETRTERRPRRPDEQYMEPDRENEDLPQDGRLGAVEQALHAIWCQVLERSAVGLTQSFFDLGGHSLLATRVVIRIRERLGIDVPLRVLFEAPTIAELAHTIASRMHAVTATAAATESRGAGMHSAAVPSVVSPPETSRQRLLARLDQLSDVEIAAMLAALDGKADDSE